MKKKGQIELVCSIKMNVQMIIFAFIIQLIVLHSISNVNTNYKLSFTHHTFK